MSGAEAIREVNARAIGGDAAGFARVWKVFETRQWRSRAEKESGEGEEGKEEDDAGASVFE